MRTYGRVTNELGQKIWITVTTDAAGYNDAVWITTLAQTLKLNLGESPFFANYGIPAHASVLQQIQPDFYMAYTQQQFAQYFASLILAKVPTPPNGDPVYQINVVTQQGFRLSATVVPTVLLDGFGDPILDGFGNPIGGAPTTTNMLPT